MVADQAMAPLPDILRRYIVFVGRESGHRWSAERIRAKLSLGITNFAADAQRLTESELGPENQFQGDDEDARSERRMWTQCVEDYKLRLERTEAYLWGLGIAGIYHQFERDVREVIADFQRQHQPKLYNAKFDELSEELTKLGYQIRQSAEFDNLDTARLISNAIKHGEGDSFNKLVEKRRDLFPDHQHLTPGTPPDVDDLRVGAVQFNQTICAISKIWPEMEAAISATSGRT